MSHRHYVFIADVIAQRYKQAESMQNVNPMRAAVLDELIRDFASALRGTNAAFDAARFADAARGAPCGRDRTR
jgi:hypothetical protein